jgi:hypothetical protein
MAFMKFASDYEEKGKDREKVESEKANREAKSV